MSKLTDVAGFEVRRNLRKRGFWFTSLMPPVLILAVIAISVVSSNSASKSSQQQADTISKTAKIAILDRTGLINKQQLTKQHLAIEPTKQAGIAAVQANKLDAFFYYPPDVSKSGIDIYAQDQGISNTPPYGTAATALLRQDVISRVSSLANNNQIVPILQNDPAVTTTTYKNGKVTNGLAGIIAPGMFMLAFLTLVALLSYFMISATTEEKENRAAEILLASISSRSLILGKILSIFILGLVQILLLGGALLIGYTLFRSHISLPGGVSLSHIPLDGRAIAFGALFFVGGITTFTGFLVGLSALFPSAQEAGRYLGVAIITQFIPIYALGYIVSSPHTLIVNVFTYFPLTASTTSLLRNAAGTLSLAQACTALAVVAASAVLAMAFAIKAFRYGAMEYGRRVGIKELLR